MISRKPLFCAAALLTTSLGASAHAEDIAVNLRFADHHFTPPVLMVPVGKPITIHVANDSQVPIEFESFALNREKVVTPGTQTIVHLPALDAGQYEFFDDFDPSVPKGSIVAK